MRNSSINAKSLQCFVPNEDGVDCQPNSQDQQAHNRGPEALHNRDKHQWQADQKEDNWQQHGHLDCLMVNFTAGNAESHGKQGQHCEGADNLRDLCKFTWNLTNYVPNGWKPRNWSIPVWFLRLLLKNLVKTSKLPRNENAIERSTWMPILTIV